VPAIFWRFQRTFELSKTLLQMPKVNFAAERVLESPEMF
jgi:hypothetical protein